MGNNSIDHINTPEQDKKSKKIDRDDLDDLYDDEHSRLIQEVINMRAYIDYEKCKKQIKEIEAAKQIKDDLKNLQNKLSLEDVIPNVLFPHEWSRDYNGDVNSEIVNIIRYITCKTGCDEFTAVFLFLFSISAAARGKYIVKIDDEWEEPIVLFFALCTESESMISKILKLIMRPHQSFEEQKQNEYQEWKTAHSMSGTNEKAKGFVKRLAVKKHAKNVDINSKSLKKFANNVKKDDRIIEKVFEVDNDKYLPSLIVEDTSFRKLYDHMYKNGGGCTFFSDTGSSFLHLVCQNKAPLEIFSKCYNSKNFLYAKNKDEEILLRKPFMNIYLTTTPDIIRQLYSSKKFNIHGLTPRFMVLFHKPDYPLIIKKTDDAPQMPNEDIYSSYEARIKTLLENCYSQDNLRTTTIIEFDEPAKLFLTEKQKTVERSQSYFPDGDAHYRSYTRLEPSFIARISAILHIWRYPDPENHTISEEDVLFAGYIVRVLARHAQYAFSSDGIQAYYDAQKILDWIGRHRHGAFTSTQVARGVSGMTNQNIFPALDALEGLNAIRQLIIPGRPRLCVCHHTLF